MIQFWAKNLNIIRCGHDFIVILYLILAGFHPFSIWTWSYLKLWNSDLTEKKEFQLFIDSSKDLFQIWWYERGHKKWRFSNMEERRTAGALNATFYGQSLTNWTQRAQETLRFWWKSTKVPDA